MEMAPGAEFLLMSHPGNEGSSMFKRQSARKRATSTGKGGTPPTPAAHQTESKRVEQRDVTASSHPTAESRRPPAEQVAVRAYHLWQSRGEPFGTDWEDWLEAERQLATTA
jgi:Protein of unknown function (DUF2934)